MSTTPAGPTPPQPPKPAAAPMQVAARPIVQQSKLRALIGYLVLGRRRPGEVSIISHSNLFYWWPVWAVGFIMVGVSYFHGTHASFIAGNPAVVTFTPNSEYEFDEKAEVKNPNKYPNKDPEIARKDLKEIKAIVTDNAVAPFPTTRHGGVDKHMFPIMHNSKNPGVIFSITLLLVIVITNVPLRGLWSVIIIIIIVLGSIIFALNGWWDYLLSQGRLLAVHINMGAYFFISVTLFILWIVNFIFFDRQRYLAVTSGQVRLHLAVGEGEIVYDTMGMVFQKQRSDLFRHWILGLGSGDLIIRPAGGKDPIDLPNVLFVGNKVREIQMLIKEKEVVAG